ncbi:MAG: hypothetical protein ACE361_04775 [Aureliella sp.]
MFVQVGMGQRVLSSIGLMQSKHIGRVVPGQFAMVYGSLLVHRFVCRFLVVFKYRFQRSKDTSVALGEQVTGVSGGGESTFINTSKVGSDQSRLDKVTLANRTRVSDVAGRCKVWGGCWMVWLGCGLTSSARMPVSARRGSPPNWDPLAARGMH